MFILLNTFKKPLWLLERIERTSLVYVWSTRGGWKLPASEDGTGLWSCSSYSRASDCGLPQFRDGRGSLPGPVPNRCSPGSRLMGPEVVPVTGRSHIDMSFRLACILSSRGEGVGIWHRAGSMSVWTSVCIHSRGSWLTSCSRRECQRSSNVIANKLATSSWTSYLKRPAASRFWASQQSTPWCRDAARCWVLWINQSLKTFEKAFVYLLQCDLFAGCFYSFGDRGIKPGNIRKLFACGFAAFWSCTNLY